MYIDTQPIAVKKEEYFEPEQNKPISNTPTVLQVTALHEQNSLSHGGNFLPPIPSYKWKPDQKSHDSQVRKSDNEDNKKTSADNNTSFLSQQSSTPAMLEFGLDIPAISNVQSEDDHEDMSTYKKNSMYWRAWNTDAPSFQIPVVKDSNGQSYFEPSYTGPTKKRQHPIVANINAMLPQWMGIKAFLLLLALTALAAIGSALVYEFDKGFFLRNPGPEMIESSNDIQIYEWKQSGITLNGAESNVWFGYSTSLSADGTKFAVGMPMSPNNPKVGVVHVYFYDNYSKQWQSLGEPIQGIIQGDRFGWSVALSPDGFWLGIGAKLRYNYQTGTPIVIDSGCVRIYNFDLLIRRWLKRGLDINGDNKLDNSGYSISLSNYGTKVAIGAPGSEAGTRIGSVSIYEQEQVAIKNPRNDFQNKGEDVIRWNQVGSSISGKMDSELLGKSISISSDGTRLAVGSIGLSNTDSSQFDSNGENAKAEIVGGVAIYELTQVSNPSNPEGKNSTWEQIGQTIMGEGHNDLFGFSVSLSGDGNCVAVGSPKNDGEGFASQNDMGHVRVYQFYEFDKQNNLRSNSTWGIWSKLGKDIDGKGEGGNFGGSLQLSADGRRLAVGAALRGKGHASIFEFSMIDERWIKLGEDIEGLKNGDFAGYSVSLSANGDRIVIGSPMNDDKGENSGNIQVFDLITRI